MVITKKIRRFEVWLVGLNPTVGSEINKNRPCVVASPDEANIHLNTVIAVPLTSTKRDYPTRINCRFQEKEGQLAIDQIRSVDKSRFISKLGVMDDKTNKLLCDVLKETFEF